MNRYRRLYEISFSTASESDAALPKDAADIKHVDIYEPHSDQPQGELEVSGAQWVDNKQLFTLLTDEGYLSDDQDELSFVMEDRETKIVKKKGQVILILHTNA